MPKTPSDSQPQAHRSAAVYRLYDAEGALLYVGSAYNPEQRSKKHRGKEWWPEVARREDEWHPSREAAYVAETEAIAAERPAGNRISGPGAVAAPAPKRRAATPLFALAEVDAYIDQLREETPSVRARKLTDLLVAVASAVHVDRRRALREMHEGGMTYRQIAAELDISFGRVRQILAEGTERPAEAE